MHVSRVFLEERISEGLRVKLSRPETCNGRPVIDAPVRLLSLLRKWLSGSGEGNYNFCFMCGSLFLGVSLCFWGAAKVNMRFTGFC